MSRSGWSWLIFCSFAVVAANALLRAGIDRSGVSLFSGDSLQGLVRDLTNLAIQPLFIVSLALYGVAMLSWFRIVSTEPLSVAYPVLATLTFVGVTLVGVLLFAEPLGLRKVGGVIVILTGLYLISSG